MTLPPQCNLLAVRSEDPQFRARLLRQLRAENEFAEIWEPAPGWIAAAALVPDSVPDDATARGLGLAFAEGRQHIADSQPNDPGTAFRRLAELTDREPEKLAQMPGDFTFLRFRPDGSVSAVRACAGLVPIYWREHQAGLALSTRLEYLVRYLPVANELDPLVNAMWMTGRAAFPEGRTFVRGIFALERATCMAFAPGGTTTKIRYWSPPQRELSVPSPAAIAEHVAGLRELVVRALATQLTPGEGNLLSLSGGVDSSTLGAVAGGIVGRKFSCWSMLAAPEEEYLKERSYIDEIVQRFGVQRRWDMRLTKDARFRLMKSSPPIVFHVLLPVLCCLSELKREAPIKVIFGGEYADSICGAFLTMPDWIAQTPLWKLVAGWRQLPNGPRDFARWFKHRLLSTIGRPMVPLLPDLPDMFAAPVREEYRDWYSKQQRLRAADPLPWGYRAASLRWSEFTTQSWEGATALGVRRCFPFFSRELMDLAYAMHPMELIGPGYKKPLRAAFDDVVPHRNLYRPDRGHYSYHLRHETTAPPTSLSPLLARTVRPDWLPAPPSQVDHFHACALAQLNLFCCRLDAVDQIKLRS